MCPLVHTKYRAELTQVLRFDKVCIGIVFYLLKVQ